MTHDDIWQVRFRQATRRVQELEEEMARLKATDAARDVLTRAKQILEGYADNYAAMSHYSISRGGDGRVGCTAVMHDIRNNMVGWITAEIERLDGAKGE